MFEKIKKAIQRLAREPQKLDPSRFEDDIASKTEWTTMSRSSANFRTHKLRDEGGTRLEFVATIGARMFGLVFCAIGLGIIIVFTLLRPLEGEVHATYVSLGLTLMGSVFFSAGVYLTWFVFKPVVFDKRNGYFWIGRKSPEMVFDLSEIRHHSKLKDIYALQLLSRFVSGSGDSASYMCYELNLVLRDGNRIHVLSHGGKGMREDAKKIADFIGKPLWDAC